MLVYFRCPSNVREKANELIAKGIYPDFSTLCLTALENQILLEETQGQPEKIGQVRKVPHPEAPARATPLRKVRSERSRSSGKKTRPIPGSVKPIEDNVAHGESPTQALVGSSVSGLLPLQALPEHPPFPLPRAVSDLFEPNSAVPVDRWLFGQYNRLLPAKISIRALAVIAKEGREALLLEGAAPMAADAAARLGDYLRAMDEHFGVHRDDALSTAFPETGIEGEKGRLRYQNQFVGHMVKGEQGGLLVGLKLATIQVQRNRPLILPTEAGWRFARLSNPVLDTPVVSLPSKFSSEEIDYLLRHIMQHVPVELFAYRVMLSLISEGMNTPDLVSKGLTFHLSPGRDPGKEEDFISTQRGGALGRMADLELVTRERQSTRITYQLTARGVAFLKDTGSVMIGTAVSRS